jgi:fatty acid desaturase
MNKGMKEVLYFWTTMGLGVGIAFWVVWICNTTNPWFLVGFFGSTAIFMSVCIYKSAMARTDDWYGKEEASHDDLPKGDQ